MFKVYCHSVYISQKSCFRLKTKINPLTCRCNFYSPYSKKNVYLSLASNFFHKKRHSCEFFTQNDNSVKKFLSILCSHSCGIIYTRFHAFKWWRKNRYVNFFSKYRGLYGGCPNMRNLKGIPTDVVQNNMIFYLIFTISY